jgi:hypothetical protein
MGQPIRSAQRLDQIENDARPIGRQRFLDSFQVQRAGDSPRPAWQQGLDARPAPASVGSRVGISRHYGE